VLDERNKMKQKIAIIHWHDAVLADTSQMSREEASQLPVISGISCGLVVANTKEKIVLATDWFYEHDNFRSVSVYPKSAVDKIEFKLLKRKEVK
jgi:predicted transcriptional regulator